MAQEEDGVPKGHCGQEAFDEPETTAESKSGRYHILMPSETGQKGSNTTLIGEVRVVQAHCRLNKGGRRTHIVSPFRRRNYTNLLATYNRSTGIKVVPAPH